jgi:enamine deaminase RidA (YjgF/YER057c/UK114 family)
MKIQRIEPGVRMSQCVVAGGLAFLAGQVADDVRADIKGQTTQVLAQIDALLAKAGTSKTNLLSANIYLQNMADFGAMNQVWDGWVAPDGKPARATVQAALATPDYLVEIQVVAAM